MLLLLMERREVAKKATLNPFLGQKAKGKV
jgi:hypothetical protein